MSITPEVIQKIEDCYLKVQAIVEGISLLKECVVDEFADGCKNKSKLNADLLDALQMASSALNLAETAIRHLQQSVRDCEASSASAASTTTPAALTPPSTKTSARQTTILADSKAENRTTVLEIVMKKVRELECRRSRLFEFAYPGSYGY